jgi:hypothetical protein
MAATGDLFQKIPATRVVAIHHRLTAAVRRAIK